MRYLKRPPRPPPLRYRLTEKMELIELELCKEENKKPSFIKRLFTLRFV